MKELRTLASRQGIDSLSTPVNLEEEVSIDLVVLGSVAVDKLGHRIGKGEILYFLEQNCRFGTFFRRRIC